MCNPSPINEKIQKKIIILRPVGLKTQRLRNSDKIIWRHQMLWRSSKRVARHNLNWDNLINGDRQGETDEALVYFRAWQLKLIVTGWALSNVATSQPSRTGWRLSNIGQTASFSLTQPRLLRSGPKRKVKRKNKYARDRAITVNVPL